MLCSTCCRNGDPMVRTLWVWMTWLQNACTATAWAGACTGTCLRPATRTSPRGPREAPPCRAACLCLSPTQPRRWTWPQRPRSPPSPSTPPRSPLPISQRPTTSHGKRSTPKKLGPARSPPRRYSSDPSVEAARSQVPSRLIRDCNLAEVESFYFSTLFVSVVFFVFFLFPSSQKAVMQRFPVVCHEILSAWKKTIAVDFRR